MKRKSFILPVTVFAMLVSFGLAACNNGSNESKAADTSQVQEKITITAEGGKNKLLFGETVQLSASVDGVTWESAKPEIATVSATGLVTAVSKGSASITATKEGYRGGNINITVDYPNITLTAEGNKTTLMYGESVQLTSSIDGVTWSSSDATVASVSDAGLVTSVSKGTATIKASKDHYNDGTVTITVNYPNITVTAAEDKTELLLNETVQLASSIDGVTWASSDATIASVSDAGLVTALKYGKAKISASKEHHNSGEVTINVIRPAASATLHMEDAEHYSADGSWSTDGRGPGEAGPVYSPSSGNPSDGTCIAYFGAGDKETLKFSADKAIEVELVLTVGYYYTIDNLAASIGAKFNNVDLVIPAQTYESEGATSYSYKQFSLGNVTLINGENVLELTMLENAQYYPYIDDLQFFAAEALSVQVITAPSIEVNKSLVILEAADETFQIVSETTGLTYESNAETVATVSETGLITAVANGKAVITVSKDGMKSAKIVVGVGVNTLSEDSNKIEAESCLFDGAITTRTASTGETIINAWPKNASIIIAVKVAADGTFTFSFNGRAGGSTYSSSDTKLAEDAEIEVNGVKLEGVTGTVTGRTFTDYPLGDISLSAGLNIITFKNLKTGPAIDYFTIAAKA